MKVGAKITFFIYLYIYIEVRFDCILQCFCFVLSANRSREKNPHTHTSIYTDIQKYQCPNGIRFGRNRHVGASLRAMLTMRALRASDRLAFFAVHSSALEMDWLIENCNNQDRHTTEVTKRGNPTPKPQANRQANKEKTNAQDRRAKTNKPKRNNRAGEPRPQPDHTNARHAPSQQRKNASAREGLAK